MGKDVEIQKTSEGIDQIQINNAFGSATISLLGATVIDWTPQNAQPVLWLSPQAMFKPGKGIRGGVPICWPWFGAHAEHSDFPAHGTVRTQLWSLSASEALQDGATRVTLSLALEQNQHWPYATELEYVVTLGETLTLELLTRNTGDEAFTITQALHTYFNVGDIAQVNVTGLEDKDYLDKPDAFARKHQTGAIEFSEETDRVYLDTESRCVIHDAALQRQIVIECEGSRSTVVWNPWADIARSMADMPDDGYRRMLCVETANAFSDARAVEPGESLRLMARYRLA